MDKKRKRRISVNSKKPNKKPRYSLKISKPTISRNQDPLNLSELMDPDTLNKIELGTPKTTGGNGSSNAAMIPSIESTIDYSQDTKSFFAIPNANLTNEVYSSNKHATNTTTIGSPAIMADIAEQWDPNNVVSSDMHNFNNSSFYKKKRRRVRSRHMSKKRSNEILTKILKLKQITPASNCSGNFYDYYSQRMPGLDSMIFMDPRLKVLSTSWFADRTVLDIGCSTGQMDIWIAKNLNPKFIHGIDCDHKSIRIAKKNLSYFLPVQSVPKNIKPSMFPSLIRAKLGPIVDTRFYSWHIVSDLPYLDCEQSFPANISFKQENFLPANAVPLINSFNNVYDGNSGSKKDSTTVSPFNEESFSSPCSISTAPVFADSLPIDVSKDAIPIALSSEQTCNNVEEFKCTASMRNAELLKNASFDGSDKYDLILCLSVTKWIHLNYGDDGLKLAFKKMYAQLNQNGKLILEFHPWHKYKSCSKFGLLMKFSLTNIKFRPNMFITYLMSKNVGFSRYKVVDPPRKTLKKFDRPIYILFKE